MYAQVSYLQVPMNCMPKLRRMIENDYLPIVSHRPGFKAGYLLEQEDDADTAQLVLLWEDQASVERFNRTGMLQATIQALACEMPGLKVRRQSYVVRVMAATPELAFAGV